MQGLIVATCVALALSGLHAPETQFEPKDEEIIVREVCDGLWGTGAARRANLENAGYDYDSIQAKVNEVMPVVNLVNFEVNDKDGNADSTQNQRTANAEWVPDPDGSVITPRGGINYYFDQYETYYNLPMDGVIRIARAHGIGGEYWEREDGAKMLGEYIMLATNNSVYPIGTLVPCSLGMGISLDTGSFAARNPYQVDIAVTW